MHLMVRRGYLYRRQELLEISAVPVPMHTDALAMRSPESNFGREDVKAMRNGVCDLWRAVVSLAE